jgi:hypothetical protein
VPGQHVVSKVLLKQFAVPTNGGKQLLAHSLQYGKACGVPELGRWP